MEAERHLIADVATETDHSQKALFPLLRQLKFRSRTSSEDAVLKERRYIVMAKMAKISLEQGNERRRLQLDFSSEAYERLDQIKERTRARSNGDVVRDALRLYEWYLEQKDKGLRLQLSDGEVVREVELIF